MIDPFFYNVIIKPTVLIVVLKLHLLLLIVLS